MTYDPRGRTFEDDPARQGQYGAKGPSPASPLDSRYGGPKPWTEGLKDYVALGTPGYGDRPFEGLGKTNIATALPFAPVATRDRNQAPTPVGAPQPGLFEAFGGGLTGLASNILPFDMLTSIFGSGLAGDVEQHVVNGAGAIGSVFDGILDFVPVMDFLPGGGDIEGTYGRLPEDELKADFDAMISANPTARLEYMKQYLDQRGGDIARMNGFSGDMAELAGPSADFSEQLRRIVFGGMMMAGNQTAKAWVNNGSLRDVEGTILNRDDADLPAALVELKGRLTRGELTRGEFNDELAVSEFRWTQDTGPGGMFINLFADIVTDPLIWASFGLGGVAKAGANGAVRTAMLRTTQSVRKAGLEKRMGAELASKFKMSPEGVIKSGSDDMLKAKYEWAKRNATKEYDGAISSLGRTQKTLYKLDPIIQPVATIANEVDSMFGMFGATHAARRLSAFRGAKHVEGYARAVGVKRVKRTQGFFGKDLFDSFNSYFGIASANLSAKIAGNVEAHSLLGAGKALDSASERVVKVQKAGRRGTPAEHKSNLVETPGHTPTDAGRAAITGSMEEALPREAEQAFLQYMEVFLPHGKQTAEAVTRAVQEARIAMADDLAAATGKTQKQALKHLEGSDRRELAFVHFVLYGRQVKMFNEAKLTHIGNAKAHLAKAQKAGADPAVIARMTEEVVLAERLTLVSENLLTRTDAQKVLADIAAPGQAGIDAARSAVNQYDQLDINWGKGAAGNAITDADLVVSLTKHLEALLKADGALTDIVDKSKLNPTVASALDNRYRVGHAPTDVWGVTRAPNGDIIGVNPFVEVLSDVDTGMSRGVTWYDRIKEGLVGPISGSRLHAENKMRMRVNAASEFGMRRADSDALFNAINKTAIEREKGARAFSADELQIIADQAGVIVDPAVNAKYGGRALLHLVLTTYEGDLAMMGVTSKLTAKLKSSTGRAPLGDNIVSKIAEDLYPKFRFSLSPIFLAMEMVEGPFFGILRGIKPGWRVGVDDIRMDSILADIQPGAKAHETGAGIGRAQLAFVEGKKAVTVQEASLMTKTWNKVMPSKFKRNPMRLKGPRWYNIYEWKKLKYTQQAGREAGLNWQRTMKQEFPDAYHQWELASGSVNPTKVFMTYMESAGAFDPSKRHALHMFDAAKPDNMGLERIRTGDVATFQGQLNFATMREAIDSGALTRDDFVNRYTDLGLNKTYAERAWQLADGFTEAEWNLELERALGKEEAAAAINFHQWMANGKGITVEEFLNREYGQVAEVVQKASLVPGVAMKQTVRASLEGMGAKVHERGSTLHSQTKARSSAYLPETKDLGDPTDSATLPGKIAVAQRSLLKGNGAPVGKMSPERRGLLSSKLAAREAVYEDMYLGMRSAFGSNEASMKDAANWYDEMTTMFLGVAELMPDEMVERLMRQWDDSATTPTARRGKGQTAKALKDMTTEEKQVEIAARLNIAFSGSQMNTSVESGMKYVAKMMDEVFEEKDFGRLSDEAVVRIGNLPKKDPFRIEFFSEGLSVARRNEMIEKKVATRYGFEVVGRRMEDLLRDFAGMDKDSIAQKLSDFNDNLAGRTVRSSSPLDIHGNALQPAAMDIWMKRIFGHGDEAYLGYLTDAHMRTMGWPENAKNRARADKAVRKHQGWAAEGDLGKGKAPNEVEYEWMLQRTNEFKDWLNKSEIDGPNGQWSAHEIQAMLWVGEQKRLNYEGTPTAGVLTQIGSQLSVDTKSRRFPNVLELVAEHGDEAGQAMAAVQRDVNAPLMAAIAEKVGVVSLRTLDGSGTGSTNVIFSNKEASFRAAGHMAAALDEPVIRMGKGSSHHTLDVGFDPVLVQADVKPYLSNLSDYIAEYVPDYFIHQSTSLMDDNSFAVRSVTKKNIAGTEKNPIPFDQLPPDILAALEDGSWVKAFDPDAGPMPVTVKRGRVDFDRITPEEGRTIVGDAELVNQYRADAFGATERAYADHAPKSATNSLQRANLADGATKPQRQPRTGDVRAGFKPAVDASGKAAAALPGATKAERAALYFVNNAVNATSGVHEAFHLFARHLDDSAKRELLDGYNAAHGLTGPRKKRSFNSIEEWVAAEFEGFAAGDIDPNATYTATFKTFAEWGQKHPGIKKGSVVSPIFEKVMEGWSDIPSGFGSLDERRIWESARISLLKAEDEAHSTAYYRRSPNWIGRTVNHPYLGAYPANYMWGKVLPELSRFMLRRPFGLKAPMGGLLMYNHVHRAVAEQLATDPGLTEFIENHPDSIRFLTMMLPGNPMEMPVNLPVVARRAMEHDAENRVRREQGVKEEEFGLGSALSDMASYSVGFAQLPDRIGDMFGEFANNDGPNPGRTPARHATPSALKYVPPSVE